MIRPFPPRTALARLLNKIAGQDHHGGVPYGRRYLLSAPLYSVESLQPESLGWRLQRGLISNLTYGLVLVQETEHVPALRPPQCTRAAAQKSKPARAMPCYTLSSAMRRKMRPSLTWRKGLACLGRAVCSPCNTGKKQALVSHPSVKTLECDKGRDHLHAVAMPQALRQWTLMRHFHACSCASAPSCRSPSPPAYPIISCRST